jgi:Zinc knuckle
MMEIMEPNGTKVLDLQHLRLLATDVKNQVTSLQVGDQSYTGLNAFQRTIFMLACPDNGKPTTSRRSSSGGSSGSCFKCGEEGHWSSGTLAIFSVQMNHV